MSLSSRISALFFLLGIMVVITGCGLLGFDSDPCDPEILAMLKLQPPPSAAGLTESCVPGYAPGNAQYKATFTLSPADLDAFQASTRITNWQTDTVDASVWKSEAASVTSGLFGKYVDGVYMQEVLIDTGDPAQFRVYFSNAYVD